MRKSSEGESTEYISILENPLVIVLIHEVLNVFVSGGPPLVQQDDPFLIRYDSIPFHGSRPRTLMAERWLNEKI